MAVYEYRAKDLNGKVYRGQIRASDEKQAFQNIRNQGRYAVMIKEIKPKSRVKILKPRDLAAFSGQLTAMLRAGIPLIQVLEILKKNESRAFVAQIYDNVYRLVLQGGALSEAMEAQGGVFPSFLIRMLHAGEESGRLWEASERLAGYYEKEDYFRKKMISALVYPAFLLVLTGSSLVMIFSFVLPSFFGLFSSMERLPASTRLLIRLSEVVTNRLPAALTVLCTAIALCGYLLQKPFIRVHVDRLLLMVPVAGRLLRIIYTARFARTLSSLYVNGLPLVQSLEMAGKVIGNTYIKRKMETAIEQVCNGVRLSEALALVEGLDTKLAVSFYIGEEAGELDVMVDSVAKGFDYEAEEAAKRITSLAEPVLIVIMAIIIGYIMLSVLVPIYQYYQGMG